MPYTLHKGNNLLHKQLLKVTHADSLWGLDSSQEGIQILDQIGFDHLIHGNAEEMDSDLRRHKFEIILAGEIIEHVANPGKFLNSITAVMSEKTELILTTPNAFSFKGFVHSLMRREKVHEDHNYYFSYRTLKHLFGKVGLKCQEIYYYQEVVGSGLLKFLDKGVSVVTWISPVWADGLIVRATL